ncbi:MAG TPA: biosynthetic-type acetolactate synthase large subunit [Candidatus Nitrosotalea sp.]|nr:biosynthetic-type acetolactate synthase large subunit [Candidatus Nitrosotalea sp.]
MRLTGAEVVWRVLEAEGVDVIFGLPGGAIMPVYDALLDSSVRHVLVRHEQAAGHAAEGYAHATGRVGVCLTTSGPGATNLITPLADAMSDSVPIVAITGQVARAGIGKHAFQEAPITAISAPVTKANWLVMDPDQLESTLHQAFSVARSGRPGPVLVDIPKDVQLAEVEYVGQGRALPPVPPPLPPDAAIEAAAGLIHSAARPILYAGGGVVMSGAEAELLALVDIHRVPLVTTLMARGAVSDRHPLNLGMPGMHGGYAAVTAMQRCDLLIAVGARFDDRVTGRLDAFAPEARVIHIDVDRSEIGKNREVDVALIGDAKAVLGALNRQLGSLASDRGEWLAQLQSWQLEYPFAYEQADGGPIKPQFVIERLSTLLGPSTLVTAGVGQHQMWASQLWNFEGSRRWACSGGLGTMGFAIPAALGVKAAHPDETVLAIDGDGCFQMTCQELATAVAEELPLIVAILNNAHLGMVKQWQTLFHGARLSSVVLGYESPDFVRLAEAYGCVGIRVRRPDEVDDAILRARALGGRTVVIDFQVDADEMCYPIVPAGHSNDEILLGPVMARVPVL